MKLVLPSIFTALAFAGAANAAGTERMTRTEQVKKIEYYIDYTWHRQKIMGISRTETSRIYLRTKSHAFRGWVVRYWRKVANRTRVQFHSPPYLSAWLCIHRYEGSWKDTGAPFWGGLQMDSSFQSSYGAYLLRMKGTANNWTPLEQIWTAERARRSGRGFHPWPNTARTCNLI